MRYDENLAVFLGQAAWYSFKIGVGYVPTDKAPPEAVEAMERYNSYGFANARPGLCVEEWREAFHAEITAFKNTYTQMRREGILKEVSSETKQELKDEIPNGEPKE